MYEERKTQLDTLNSEKNRMENQINEINQLFPFTNRLISLLSGLYNQGPKLISILKNKSKIKT